MQDRLREIADSDLEPLQKMRAFRRLAEEAEDNGEYTFANMIRNVCSEVINPRDGKPYPNYPPRFPHSYFHARKPQVIVVKEKHGTNYYDASTPENAARACLDIIQQRLDPDFCWYMDELPEDTDPGDQLHFFKKVDKPLTEKEQAERIINFANESSDNLIKAGKAAAQFLESRREYEYEGIEFETLSVGEFRCLVSS